MATDVKTKLSVLKVVDVQKPGASVLEIQTNIPVHISLKVEASNQVAAERVLDKITKLIDELKA